MEFILKVFSELRETNSLNAMWFPGLDPGTEKGDQQKSDGNPSKLWSLVNSNIPLLILQCGQTHCSYRGCQHQGKLVKVVWGLSVPSSQLFCKYKIIPK